MNATVGGSVWVWVCVGVGVGVGVGGGGGGGVEFAPGTKTKKRGKYTRVQTAFLSVTAGRCY